MRPSLADNINENVKIAMATEGDREIMMNCRCGHA